MFIAKTINGLEDIAAKEVKGKIILPQTIAFSKPKKNPRAVNTIFELVKHTTFSSIQEITTAAESLTKKLKRKEIYDIRCSRKGEHPFKSVDVATEVGAMLREKGYIIDYKNSQKTIMIDIVNNHCILGILKQQEMCKRPYRVKYNNKSISACIAAALIMIANPKKTDSILDPLCKDGIIPVEAAMFKIKKIHALDPLKNNVRNALINCKYAKTKIVPQCYEINWLDTLFKKESIDHIITNILISKHDKEPEKIIKEFFHQAEFITKDAVTIITNKPELIKNTPTIFTLTEERKISVGEMQYTILKYKKNP